MRNARKLEFSKLLAYIAICEEGSITGAARRLSIAQSAITITLQKLEGALETPLVRRDVRGVTLTEAGKKLLQRAYEIIGLVEGTYDEIQGQITIPSGDVNIGLPSSTAAILALPLIHRISALYPTINIRLLESFSGHLWDWLNDGRLDVAVVFDKDSSTEVQCDWVGRENLHLVGRADSIPHSNTLDIKSLVSYPLILPSRMHGIRKSLEAQAFEVSADLDVRMEVDSARTLIDLIKTGNWFSVLAPCAVAPEVRRGELSSALLSPCISRIIGIAHRRSVSNQAVVKVVIHEIRNLMDELISNADWDADFLANV